MPATLLEKNMEIISFYDYKNITLIILLVY